MEFQSHKVASEMISGKTVSADITFKNISPVTWPSKPDNKNRHAVNLSYHWLTRGSGPWSVQLGSYAEKKVAAGLAKKLKDKGYDANVKAVTVKGKELHRVGVGHLEQRAEAEKLRETLRTAEKLDRAVVTRR